MRFQRLLPTLAVSVIALSGCGVAGTQFHPGIAAQVGDEQITVRHVDSISDGYCKAIESVSEDSGGTDVIPGRYLTHEFTTTLVIAAAARQLADEYGVEPTAAYQQTLAGLKPQIASLSAHERESVIEIEGAQAYYQDVLTTIGGIELGVDDGADDVSDDDKAAAGQQVLDDWFADHQVEVNPKYGFDYGTSAQVDTDVSAAVSKTAKDGLLGEPDAGYAASLPQHQVCGG